MIQGIKWCLVSCLFFHVYADEQESTLTKAQLFHEQKEYQKAEELYETLSPKNNLIWANLGDCYYAQDKKFEALICWLKAQKTTYGNQYLQLADQIHKVEQKLGLYEQESFKQKTVRCFKEYGLSIPLIFWQVIFLFLWYLMMYIFCMRRRLNIALHLIVNSVLSITVFGLYIHYAVTEEREARVIPKEISIYAGTDTRFSQKGMLVQATPVTIKKSENGWHKIVGPNGSGWVCADTLEEITT